MRTRSREEIVAVGTGVWATRAGVGPAIRLARLAANARARIRGRDLRVCDRQLRRKGAGALPPGDGLGPSDAVRHLARVEQRGPDRRGNYTADFSPIERGGFKLTVPGDVWPQVTDLIGRMGAPQ